MLADRELMKDSPDKSRLSRFFSTTLWELEPEAFTGLKRYAVKYLQILALVMRDFWDDNCLLRASALSFSTILSFVPFFALTFAVLKGFGVHNKLEPFILEQVAAGSHEIVDRIITYINNTNMTSLGAIGLITLIITVISLLGNIEEAFNAIWGVKETRSLYRRFSDYLSVLFTGPLFLLAAVSITTSLQSQTLVKWLVETSYLGDALLFLFRLAPYLIIWMALIFLYIFIPNTRVRFKSALIGGVLAGTLWELAQ
jgi:membrane protein